MSYPKFKARPSQVNRLLASVKQPKELYLEAKEELERLKGLQDSAKNTETKVYKDRAVKIENQAELVSDLNKKKNYYTLPDGAKTYCKEWLLDLMYGGVGIDKVTTKYMSKGNSVEDDGIALLSEYWGGEFYKNEDKYENEWLIGTPDVVLDDRIVDIKSSWSYNTFPIWAERINNKDYYMQLQAYMWLTSRPYATLAYVLLDTPEELRRAEIDFLSYEGLDLEFRIKTFEVEYDVSAIDLMQERIEKCQEYINAIIDKKGWNKYFEN